MTLLSTICGAEEVCQKDESGQTVNCSVFEANFGADNVAEEMKLELLQRDLHMRHKEEEKMENPPPFEEVKIAQFDCSGQVSYQSTTPPGNTKTLITQWIPETGNYGTVITLLPPMTEPAFRSMNSCGVNPIDLILYCSLEITSKGSFLVRVSADKIGFVDKLLGWRFAAAFDNSDNYYVYGEHSVHPPLGKMSVIRGVSKMKAWTSWSGLDVHAETKNAEGGSEITIDGAKYSDYRLGADFAFINETLDTHIDGEQHYMASLIGDEMKLLRTFPGPYELFTLKGINLPDTLGPNLKPRVWGTAWAYRNSGGVVGEIIYFSADDGIGLYAVNTTQIYLGKREVFTNKVGEAVHTDWNDGISCGVSNYTPLDDCTHKMYRSTTENLNKDNAKSSIVVLDPDTGKLSDDGGWKVEAQDLKGINSCAINAAKDNKIYCTMQFGNGAWIARLDSKGTIGYLMNVKGWSFAGVFDSEGRYWFYYNNDGLHMVANLDKYTAYVNKVDCDDGKCTQVQDTSLKGGLSSQSFAPPYMGADFNILVVNLRTYIVSLPETCWSDYEMWNDVPFKQKISFVEITGGVAHAAVIFNDASDPPLPQPLPADQTPPQQTPNCQTWGSSWNLRKGDDEYLLFAADSGQGIFKMLTETIDWDERTVKFEQYAKADPIAWNNGFSCRKEDPANVVIGR